MIEQPDDSEIQVDLTGQTFGGYTILRRLGRGGMADVYLARQESLDRNVALKILKPELAKDSSYITRFKREAQSAAKLVQANIVGVYEVGEIDGLHYIAQEYVVGRNLREHLGRYGAVKPVMAINILRQVALAIQKADSHGVTHRDIKPENIMLSPSGEVKVADFGLARVNDSTDKHLTQIGITMGTPLYMSPEQVEGEEVDVRSDIYSLGVTAYHMLAGEPPYDGENALAIAVKHLNSMPSPLEQVRPDVPPKLLVLIKNMMEKSPDQRPQSATELIKRLKNIKVEMDEDWDQLVETMAIESAKTVTSKSLPDSRLAVTRQLQSVMKGNIQSWWTERSTILLFTLLTLAGAAIGLWITNQNPVADPLARENVIPRLANAKLQYELARDRHPREVEFWQAVMNLHSSEDSDAKNETTLFQFMAKERIAELYLLDHDYKNALNIYSEFSRADFSQRTSVVGFAGAAVCHHGLGNIEEAQQAVSEAEQSVDLLNQFLKDRFEKAREELRSEVLVKPSP